MMGFGGVMSGPWGMGFYGLLVLILVALGIAALFKYLLQ